jgi:phosphatidylglycerol:prolipoprotein diacylglycerol transferase
MHFDSRWHLLFDLLSFSIGAYLFRRELARTRRMPSVLNENAYWISLVTGAVGGAFLAGSMNLSAAGFFRLGHSIAGALAGAIIAVELFKWTRGQTGSTGFIFVVPLLAGIVVGRCGCFFAGLADETYGIEISPQLGRLGALLGVDFGDGLLRHPVQLYESLTMLVTLGFVLHLRKHHPARFRATGFYLFILLYAASRFVWEFLKPYPKLIGPLNLFHFICLSLLLYSTYMLKVNHGKQLSFSSPS